MFCGLIDVDLQGQIQLESPNLPHLELVRTITHHPFKPEVQYIYIIYLFILFYLFILLFYFFVWGGVIDLDLQGQI